MEKISSKPLWEDGERVFSRGSRDGGDGRRRAVLIVELAADPPPGAFDRLAHEYGLKDEMGGAWAVRPLEMVRERGHTLLVLEDPGGEPLLGLLGLPWEITSFLRLAIGVATALGQVHQRGLIHKDIKPANVLVNSATG
jgi:serine/threonine protein kinase